MVKIFKKLVIVSLFFVFSGIFAAQSARKSLIQIKTIQSAHAYLRTAISNFPSTGVTTPTYEKEQAHVIIQSAKVLYDTARTQILDALSEIDSRIAYWQYQKDHPWNYFMSKNPLKWITGPSQEDEIETNLETLKSHQGELYVLLGRIAELGSVFTAGYKDTFLADYQKGYAWVDAVLDALVRIKTKEQTLSDVRFIARIQQLQAQLEKVTQFKDELLSDISETDIPSYLARNWFKGGTALLGMTYGYNKFSLEQLQQPFVFIGKGIEKNVIEPVQTIISDVFFGGASQSNLLVSQANLDVMYNTVKEFLDSLSTEGGWVQGPDITEESKQAILAEIKAGHSSLFQELTDELSRAGISKKKKWFDAKTLLYDLFVLQAGVRGQRTVAGVGKIAFMTPAIALAWGTYWGYQKLTEKSYGPLRRALVDINSLFVDPSKPLNDEQQGKMIYLIHMLKKRGEKELPTKKNVRADFIHDLERIESSEFTVAAKRAIIEDMFRKYEFLGLIQKK